MMIIGASVLFGRELTNSFDVPGLDSQQAIDLLADANSERAGTTAEVVLAPLDTDATFFDSPLARQSLAEIQAELTALPNIVSTSDPTGSLAVGPDAATAAGSMSLITYIIDIPSWAPQMASMIGLGVGIDYALFLVTRHREHLAQGMAVDESIGRAVATAGQAVIFAGGTVVIAILGLALAGVPFSSCPSEGSTPQPVEHRCGLWRARHGLPVGLGCWPHRARVITSAALIMISVFGGFIFGNDPTIKMFGVGLATAIFVDASIVRMILVPATIKLMGDANWWLPNWLDRLLPTIDMEGESGTHCRLRPPRHGDHRWSRELRADLSSRCGFHLVLISWLSWKTVRVPNWVDLFVAITGVGYVIDAIGMLTSDTYSADITRVTFIGEVVLLFWLLIKGRSTGARA
ncbi:MAG: hypothetical protein ACI81L_001432 [Verrucomicrobiales bacterium]|jgi:hypothetical protein